MYDFNDDGQLISKSDVDGTTLYDYDALGSLRSVVLPDGRDVEYLIDSANRRVGKVVDGTLVQGWLYSSQLQIAAETDGASNVTKRFVYATHRNVPDVAIIDGVEYRLSTDHLGSVRFVVDSSTGLIAQQIDYDEFGNVLSDSNPGFQPFGFAGGLYDVDTGLVRFGARDYDPLTGRWNNNDPLLFGGGQSNLYVYVNDDPVNRSDALGLSQDDVALIQDLFSIIVEVMTENGLRIDPGWLNNLCASTGGPSPHGADDHAAVCPATDTSNLQGCFDQADFLFDALSPALVGNTDDAWSIEYDESTFHHWLVMRSSNPNDQMLVLDPWADSF